MTAPVTAQARRTGASLTAASRRVCLAIGAGTVFLALSDRVFGVRVGGMNVRIAQVILAAVSLAAAWQARRGSLRDLVPMPATAAGFALALCVSFGGTIALAAEPAPTALKAAWFCVNFVTCLLFAVWADRKGVLVESLFLGVSAVAAVVWIDSIALQWAGTAPWIGFAQASLTFEGRPMWRAHAFFHEPSFAAGALFLGTAAALHPAIRSRRVAVLGLAFLVSAVVLTSSRTGIVALVVLGIAAAAMRPSGADGRRMLGNLALSFAAAAAMIGVFAIDAGGRRYVRFIAGPLGVDTWGRVQEGGEGEGEVGRLRSYSEGLADWREAPFLGRGAMHEPSPQSPRILAPGCISGWIGLLAEFGAIGALLHLGLWVAMVRGLGLWSAPGERFACAVLLTHATVSLVLGPSFVRLDYGLLALGALVAYASRKSVSPAVSPAPGAPA